MHDTVDQVTKNVLSEFRNFVHELSDCEKSRVTQVCTSAWQLLEQRLPDVRASELCRARIFALEMICDAIRNTNVEDLHPHFPRGLEEVINMVLVPRLRMVDLRVAASELMAYGFKIALEVQEFTPPRRGHKGKVHSAHQRTPRGD